MVTVKTRNRSKPEKHRASIFSPPPPVDPDFLSGSVEQTSFLKKDEMIMALEILKVLGKVGIEVLNLCSAPGSHLHYLGLSLTCSEMVFKVFFTLAFYGFARPELSNNPKTPRVF